MTLQKFNPGTLVIGGMLLLVAMVRIFMALPGTISPFANFSPVGAMALFGGACFSDRVKAFAWPLMTLWLSDVVLNRIVFYGQWRLFYEGFYWTYGTFAVIVLMGRYLIRDVTIPRFILISILAVCIHWIMTDFGVWLLGSVYPKTAAGFMACLVTAIPYERNLLIGNLVYGTALFGAYWRVPGRFKTAPVN
jgi:hypothetical protein